MRLQGSLPSPGWREMPASAHRRLPRQAVGVEGKGSGYRFGKLRAACCPGMPCPTPAECPPEQLSVSLETPRTKVLPMCHPSLSPGGQGARGAGGCLYSAHTQKDVIHRACWPRRCQRPTLAHELTRIWDGFLQILSQRSAGALELRAAPSSPCVKTCWSCRWLQNSVYQAILTSAGLVHHAVSQN